MREERWRGNYTSPQMAMGWLRRPRSHTFTLGCLMDCTFDPGRIHSRHTDKGSDCQHPGEDLPGVDSMLPTSVTHVGERRRWDTSSRCATERGDTELNDTTRY